MKSRLPSWAGVRLLLPLSAISVLSMLSTACVKLPDDSTCTATDCVVSESQQSKEDMILDLERNQARWAAAGAQSYSFSVNRSCDDCPTELRNGIGVLVNGGDDGRRVIAANTFTGFRSEDDGFRSLGNAQITSMDNYFANLRQGIINNQIQSVAYNPTYGYPQQIVVGPNGVITGGATPYPQGLTYNTANFQMNQSMQVPATSTWNGTFSFGSTNNGAGPFFLGLDNGQLHELRLPQGFGSQLSAFQNGTRVQAIGQWAPGGINGLGYISASDIIAMQQANSSVLSGRLAAGYNANPGAGFSPSNLYSYSVVQDNGQIVPVSFSNDFYSQALAMAGNRVQFSGNYLDANAYGIQPFSVGQALSLPNTPIQLSGVLSRANNGIPVTLGQNQVWLIDDAGRWNELRVPPNLLSMVSAVPSGVRVNVYGTYGAGLNGSTAINVISVNQLNNFLTDIQIGGLLGNNLGNINIGANTLARYMLTSSNGGSQFEIRIPTSLPNYGQIGAGSQVLVTGGWMPGGMNSQGIIDARYLQLLSNNTRNVNNLAGLILGQEFLGEALEAYRFQTDDGRALRLRVRNGLTTIAPQLVLAPGTRINVNGSLHIDINELIASQILGLTPFTSPQQSLTGTMVNWETVTPGSIAFIFVDDTGRTWHVMSRPNLTQNLFPGTRLTLSGSADLTVNHFEALTIESNSTTASYGSFIPPYASMTPITVTGTVTRTLPSITTMSVIELRDDNGRMYQVSYQTPGTPIFPQTGIVNVGVRVSISGLTAGGSGIQATAIQVLSGGIPAASTGSFYLPTSMAGTVTSYLQSSALTQTLQMVDDTGRSWQVTFSNPGTTILPQQSSLTSLAAGTRIRVSSNSVSPTTGAQYFQANVIEILSPTSFYTGTPGTTTGAGVSQVQVLSLTITGTGALGSPYISVGQLYNYTASDNNGRTYTLRITGQTLSNGVIGTNLSVGSFVRVIGISTINPNEIDVQRIEFIGR